MRLRGHRPEAKLDRQCGAQARRARRHGAHHHRRGIRLDPRGDAISGALRRLRDGRILHGQRRGRADRVRRFVQASRGLSADFPAAAPSAGPRGVSGRRVLPALAPARAFRARQRGIRRENQQRPREGQDRILDRAAHHRDPGGRRHGVRADQRDLHHRRPDLPGNRPVQRRHAPGHQRRHFRVARRRRRANQHHQEARRRRAPGAGAISRTGRLLAVRLGFGRGHPQTARARPARHRTHEAEAVLAHVGGGNVADAVRGEQRLFRQGRRASRWWRRKRDCSPSHTRATPSCSRPSTASRI